MWWFQQGLCFLPAALVVWTAASFIFAYITAVVLRHVDPLVPYISDTGTMAPERCVFGIMLDVSAFLGMATVYVRYKQVEALTGEDKLRLHRLNRFGLLLGLVSSMGMCVVANFQKTTLFSMHLVGAVLTFGVGALYILVQTLISLNMQPHIHSKTIYLIRLGIGVWTLGSIISMFISSVIMYSSLPGVDVPHKLHWTPGETVSSPPCVERELKLGVLPFSNNTKMIICFEKKIYDKFYSSSKTLTNGLTMKSRFSRGFVVLGELPSEQFLSGSPQNCLV
uniref:DNA-damage regulated autophagy modulator 2b n=1 Tax=Lates calcarifer TaxID=8187 RepID=A0A4W6CBZ6_LATCA